MTRLRRITSWSALGAATLASLLMLILPGYGNHARQAIAVWPGVYVFVWGIGLTIETEGARLRSRLQRRWTSESNGA
jgi:hypothetical protein